MRTLVGSFALVLVCHCGGKEGSNVGADGGQIVDPVCQPPPPQRRPQALACSLNESDGGACATDADCRQNMPPRSPLQYCYRGRCGYDDCANDSDCRADQVCRCGGESGGLVAGALGNLCVPADCHVDSDCGSCGFCAPSGDPICGPTYGAAASYYCQKPGAACSSNADCGGDGGFDTPFCAFNPMTNAWSCVKSYCAG